MKATNYYFFQKKEFLIIIIGIILSLILAIKNLENFDKIENNSIGKPKHLMITSDMRHVWELAEQLRSDLSEGKSFHQVLPIYDRAFLQPILVGLYYHILDEKIYENNEEQELVIRIQNFKLGILIIQIFIFYFAVYFFITQFSKRFNSDNKNYNKVIILIFLCYEPTILQWHSSFWSESLFLSMIIVIFGCVITPSKNNFLTFFSGILMGLMYAQKAYSIFYIFLFIIFFLLVYGKKIFPLLIFVSGFFLVMFLIGFNHYKKTDTFYIVSSKHQYYSYYHYFAHKIYADRNKISELDAKKKLDEKEKNWRIKNNVKIDSPIDKTNSLLDKSNYEDVLKNIKYRNKFFLNEVIQNPTYTLKLYIKKVIVMSILHPTLVYDGYSFNKGSDLTKKNPKEYFHKNLKRNFIYSIFIYFFVLKGFIDFILKIYKKKELEIYDKFLILNLLSILYFIMIAGVWGQPRYFAPCLINISFFFSYGVNNILIKLNKNLK